MHSVALLKPNRNPSQTEHRHTACLNNILAVDHSENAEAQIKVTVRSRRRIIGLLGTEVTVRHKRERMNEGQNKDEMRAAEKGARQSVFIYKRWRGCEGKIWREKGTGTNTGGQQWHIERTARIGGVHRRTQEHIHFIGMQEASELQVLAVLFFLCKQI